MSQRLLEKPHEDDKYLDLLGDDIPKLKQQYLLAMATVQDIFEGYLQAQNPESLRSFDNLKNHVQIQDSDPNLITILTTEMLRVLIDQYFVDFYDAVKIVSDVVTYVPREDINMDYATY